MIAESNKNNIINIDVDVDDSGKRLDVLLSELVPCFTRSRIQSLIKQQRKVFVNNKVPKSSYKIKYGDKIMIDVPEAKPLELEAQNLAVPIVYEDNDMLVVNKPSGMLTHPTTVEKEGTLVNAVLYHCEGKLSGINGVMRPGIVHRLDKDTSGLLMIAKNDVAHQSLSKQIKEKSAIRKYLTIVHGNIKEDTGTINLPIDRHPSHKCKMAVKEGGKAAISHWKVLERFGDYTFLEVQLQTGRTHQIRVHFSHAQRPVYGDVMYGSGKTKVKTNAQVLQSYKLEFTRPSDGERVFLEIEQDDELQKVLRYLRSK